MAEQFYSYSAYEENLLREAQDLRKWYADSLKEISILERYSLFSTGVLWAWCSSNTASPIFNFIIWSPLIVQILLGLQALGIFCSTISMRNYLLNIEKCLNSVRIYGWGNSIKKNPPIYRVIMGFSFWIIIHIVTIIVAVKYGKV